MDPVNRGAAGQLALAVHLRDEATLDNFLFPAQPEPLREVLVGEASEPAVYLYGKPGTGRSHLLQAACHQCPGGEALYLPLAQLRELAADAVLADVEQLSLVSLDDIDAVAGDAAWEKALFNLVNRARESGCRLLFSAACAPRQLALNLPDLRSRLSWSLVLQLPEAGDEDKLRILQFRARRRGMSLSDEAGQFILARAARSLGELMDLLDKLDQDSMVAQRQLTIPFIKTSLSW
jgi:DnaA family protein